MDCWDDYVASFSLETDIWGHIEGLPEARIYVPAVRGKSPCLEDAVDFALNDRMVYDRGELKFRQFKVENHSIT